MRYGFDEFVIDTAAFRLWRAGEPITLEPKALDVLTVLVKKQGQLVEKQELFDIVWKDVTVTDNALTRVVAQVRRALGDDAQHPKYLETAPTRGYRFIAPVRVLAPPAPADGASLAPPELEPPAAPEVTAPSPGRSELRQVVTAPPAPNHGRPYLWGAVFLGFSAVVATTWWAASNGQVRSNAAVAWPSGTPAVLRPVQLTVSDGLDDFPSLSPDGASVVYTSDRTGRFELYIRSLDGAGFDVQLTHDDQQSIGPVWSPDGEWVAFNTMTRSGVWLVPARGGPTRQLTTFGGRASWSPDSRSIAFQSTAVHDLGTPSGVPGQPSTIWVVDIANGSHPRQVTRGGEPPGSHLGPAWSADGRRVIFARGAPGAGSRSALWTTDIATGHTTRLHEAPIISDPIVLPGGGAVGFLTVETPMLWALPLTADGMAAAGPPRPAAIVPPDAKHLSIARDGRRLIWAATSLQSDIWVQPLDPVTGLTRGSPEPVTRDMSRRKTMPSYSDDGLLAYSGRRGGANMDIYVLDREGGTPRQLTTDSAHELSPTWTPDGRIEFLSTRNSVTGLWAIDPATRREELVRPMIPVPRQASRSFLRVRLEPRSHGAALSLETGGIPNLWLIGPGSSSEAELTVRQHTFEKRGGDYPAWSRDARWLAYECYGERGAHICVVPVDGSAAPAQLTADSGEDWVHSWAPDNDRITFASMRDGYWNIAWVSRTTRHIEVLTTFGQPRSYVRYPAWSPLGDRIAFERGETTGNLWWAELVR